MRREESRCRHYGTAVGPASFGGKQRNHWLYCLYSRHVDGDVPGDRASDCGGSATPRGAFTRAEGERTLARRRLTSGRKRCDRVEGAMTSISR